MTDTTALLTDLYQLTMGQAYHDAGIADDTATFDMFVRKLPTDWGYLVAAGIDDAIDEALRLRFTDSDIAYLREQHLFSDAYLDRLQAFQFTGEIRAVKEGTVIGANTPLVSITAPRWQAQLLETRILNIINYQTLVASKASRVVQEAQPAAAVDFGLRRAHDADAGMAGAKAAYLAGFAGTSNVQAGKEHGIPITGTMAHSIVMSFPTELDAFRAYCTSFPKSPTLLIDTYDTAQGARNAATVAHELAAKGEHLGAVRIDSGDLAASSKDVRRILDAQGLRDVRIVVSGDLNEEKIAQLCAHGAPIDAYGVGTELITGKPVGALSGVYKIVEDPHGHKIKLSAGKQTWPGRKQVYRQHDTSGTATKDLLALECEDLPGTPLLETVVQDGARIIPRPTLAHARAYRAAQVARLPVECTRLRAAPYAMEPSAMLGKLTASLAATHTQAHSPQEDLYAILRRWKEVTA